MSAIKHFLNLSLLLSLGWIGNISPGFAEESFHFVAFGDMPYRKTEEVKVDRLIRSVNQSKPAFTVFVGDTKSGTSPCRTATYRKILQRFHTVESPLLYTPGDNEWVDCARISAGLYQPTERLNKVRSLFYLSKPSLTHGLSVTRQEAPFFENARWEREGVVFATLHVVGSENNRRNRAEFNARLKADLAWLSETFRHAKASHARGVVVFWHGDPQFEQPPAKRGGFQELTAAMIRHVENLGVPVLLIHGDSHVYRLDHPWMGQNGFPRLPQFTRVIVFGDGRIHAVRVTVTPNAAEPFTITPLIVKENL